MPFTPGLSQNRSLPEGEDEESDFDCRESSIASTTSATSVASGTRIFRADATTASAEAEGRIPPIPRASAVFGATAEANPRSHRYESRIEKVSVRFCSTSISLAENLLGGHDPVVFFL